MGEVFKVADRMTKFSVGDEIQWGSQAAGISKIKGGVVIAVLGPDEDLHAEIHRVEGKRPAPSAVQATRYTSALRYVVRVHRHYYAPLAKIIDGNSRSAGKLVKRVA